MQRRDPKNCLKIKKEAKDSNFFDKKADDLESSAFSFLRPSMTPLLIQLGNGIWLMIIFIGVPAVSSLRFGSLQIASRPTWHMLAIGGILLGGLVNAGYGGIFARSKREKRMCLNWLGGYIFFGMAFWAYTERIIHFRWLKNILLEIQRFIQ